MKQIRLKDYTYIIKTCISVILMRENVPCKNKTLRSLLYAIIVSIWLGGFLLLMIGILSIYQLCI